MDGITSWVTLNWFNLAQAVGIIATLIFNGVGLHRQAKATEEEAKARHKEAKAREVENLLTLSEHHQELWASVAGREDLKRVFLPDADVQKVPPTVPETEFLNVVFVHFLTGWRIAESGGITSPEDMKLDIQGTFSLPVPGAVWNQTKAHRNQRFVSFVESALG